MSSRDHSPIDSKGGGGGGGINRGDSIKHISKKSYYTTGTAAAGMMVEGAGSVSMKQKRRQRVNSILRNVAAPE